MRLTLSILALLGSLGLAAPPRYKLEIVGLGTMPNGEARIRGGIAGGVFSDTELRPWIMRAEVPEELPKLEAGLGTWVFGTASDGTAAGGSSLGVEGYTVAVRWSSGNVLSQLAKASNRPSSIAFSHADNGHSAGMVHELAFTDNNDTLRRAAYWGPDGSLRVIDAFNRGIGWDVNSKGWVTGFIDFPGFASRPFRWNGSGAPTQIDLPGPYEYGSGTTINEWGQIAGYAALASGVRHAFLTTPQNVLEPLLAPEGSGGVDVTGLNDGGVLVGRTLLGADFAGMAWSEADGFQDVNDLIDVPDGWDVKFLTSIDSDGSMAGQAYKDGVGYYPVILRPLSKVRVGSLSVPEKVYGGLGVNVMVTLTEPAPAEGTLVRLSTSSPLATITPTVLIPAGETVGNAALTLSPVSSPSSIGIRGVVGYAVKTTSTTLEAPVVSNFLISPFSGVGGPNRTGLVEINAPAPPANRVVTLTVVSGLGLSLPSNVTVPAGHTSVEFAIPTTPVSAPQQIMANAATGDVSFGVQAEVKPPSVELADILATINLAQTPLSMKVTLNGKAPAGGSTVTLVYSRPEVLTGPATVVVPAGALSATLNLTSKSVAADALGKVTATLNGVSKTDSVRIVPSIRTVALSAAKAKGGMTLTGTVVLGGAAPATGLTVTFSSTLSGVQLPASVKVAAGKTSAPFSLKVLGSSSTVTGLVKATYRNRTASTPLQVLAPVVNSMTLVPAIVKGGLPSTARAFLDSVAPPGGFKLLASSSLTSVATVPASVTVPAGQKSVAFMATTKKVTAEKKPTITVRRGTMTKSVVLTVRP